MYLLDSCTISDFMKGDVDTASKIKAVSPNLIYTSTVTQMEITYGLLRKFDKNHSYFTVLEDFFSVISVLPFDRKATLETAVIRKKLEAAGKTIGAYDALIAGIAIAENLILVTSNIREFTRIEGLIIENWRN